MYDNHIASTQTIVEDSCCPDRTNVVNRHPCYRPVSVVNAACIVVFTDDVPFAASTLEQIRRNEKTQSVLGT